ncbi:histidinol-phosphate phosphatase [Rubrobacter xylanophilus DSM 9941]|uniref:Histidinol-phosphatase n=1 Tax=Rubrobacter xylanophilus (strain DSM 9941 / JCM 11954 / NBRC 16129 / PRD-1) TaxID=266117 RepID=Q1AY63_RUBXD|nr:inositol monophosphatase family protein [Rubrobacter xylanophilus]ABG03665.1 histidinol-phosphate phosphatase [Rubrobacter xylanophilus DSM 9941]
MERDLRGYMELAAEAAWEAGRLTLGYFRRGVGVETKADGTEVTRADREAEALLRRRIQERCPGHGILGEEGGESGEGARARWILDPIDGTRAFVRGVPLYAVLVGLEVEGRCEAGAAYFPALDEMVCAASGEGCFLNGRRVRVSATEDLGRALCAFTDAASFERHGRGPQWGRVLRSVGSCRGWSDAYGHALVATGRADLMLDPVVNPWDCAPFPPILREAGGYFGDWSGEETIYGGEALSTTRRLLPEVLRLLGPQNG